MAWNFFVHHYQKNEERDAKYREEQGGVLYPRAGTLGGCTAHNAMITVVPHDSDWDAHRRADGRRHRGARRRCGSTSSAWSAASTSSRRSQGTSNPSGHGFNGWLDVSRVDPHDRRRRPQTVVETRSSTSLLAVRWRFWYRAASLRRIAALHR